MTCSFLDRWNLKVGSHDHSEGSFQDIPDDADAKHLKDFARSVPQHTQKVDLIGSKPGTRDMVNKRLWQLVQT